MTKHGEIAEHLASLDHPSVTLMFDEIERLLGHPLPPSARNHNAWWSNPTNDSHRWARAWVVAGWRTERVNLSENAIHFRRTEPTAYHGIESWAAIEGHARDRTILSRTRNANLAAQCKKRDDNTCVACGFKLEIDGKFIMECHHLNPLSVTDETETILDDLVSLCPTCHMIAHMRSPLPYSIASVKSIRQSSVG